MRWLASLLLALAMALPAHAQTRTGAARVDLAASSLQAEGRDRGKPRPLDLRLIASTGRDLAQMVEAGTFRYREAGDFAREGRPVNAPVTLRRLPAVEVIAQARAAISAHQSFSVG